MITVVGTRSLCELLESNTTLVDLKLNGKNDFKATVQMVLKTNSVFL